MAKLRNPLSLEELENIHDLQRENLNNIVDDRYTAKWYENRYPGLPEYYYTAMEASCLQEEDKEKFVKHVDEEKDKYDEEMQRKKDMFLRIDGIIQEDKKVGSQVEHTYLIDELLEML